ncbi:unnamed protein product [Urochloa decumbens]|uniref:F-box domain-containing protein n=1 Tax=Urochloa decumbens TaxID=240449 RepID=A0ABC9AFU0_9POAL
MPPPPPPLMDELVEEFLLRLPPENPASLIRTSLVCKRWRRILTDRGFRHRFLERHRTPPILGFLHRFASEDASSCFTATSTFRPRDADLRCRYVLGSHHGRVLIGRLPLPGEPSDNRLCVWDPITGDRLELPKSPMSHDLARISWNAAVLCSSSSRVCNHLDCRRGPFLVVLMSTSADEVFVDIYSSEAGTWRPANAMQHPADDRVCLLHAEPSTLSGSALYFKVQMTMHTRSIQYSLGTRRIDYLTLPSDCSYRVQLTATEHGGLGFAKLEGSRLHLWTCGRGRMVLMDIQDGHKVVSFSSTRCSLLAPA